MSPASSPTDPEKEAIYKLRERMSAELEPEMYEDDRFLYRFLKARDFNINNAESMLRKHLEWREKYDVKNISKFKKTEVLEKYLPINFIGYDKEGCVIRYIPFGTTDYLGVHKSCKLEDEIKFMIYETEQDIKLLKEQSEKLGKNVEKSLFISSVENLSFGQATDKRGIYNMISLSLMYMNNYPERLKGIYIIHGTSYFQMLFSILKAFAPKSLTDKFHIYSDDSWKEDLLKIVDADVLPGFLGGNRTDPDGNPLCLSLINYGGPVPESFYIDRGTKSLSKSPDVETVTLSRAAFHEVKIDVKEPGSYLEWEFETKCRDIGFGVFYRETVDGEEKITEIKAIQRINTAEYPETGTFKCDDAGTYVLVFDNTYSMIREKEIYYRTRIVPPKEYEAEVNEESSVINCSS